ncbi:MAG: hypothetical protein Q9184_004808 [Pyrenodesmia sp. 2 TL-2023]
MLESWNIKPRSIVGHLSGKIAAVYATGILNRAGAIISAFYRGRAASNCREEIVIDVGMPAVGLGAEATTEFLGKYTDQAWIAYFDSPSSVTVSGRNTSIEALRAGFTAAGHFARRLQADLAYHSELMGVIDQEYARLLTTDDNFHSIDSQSAAHSAREVNCSSITISKRAAAAYVLDCKDAGRSLFDVAGRLFVAGAPVDIGTVNQYEGREHTIVDLPNYA